MTTTEAQVLVDKFGPSVNDGSEIQKECLKLMTQFSLTAEELHVKWESYALSRKGNEPELSCTELSNLQEYIMADLEKENLRTIKKPRLSMPLSTKKAVNSPEAFMESMFSTPASRKKKAIGSGSNGGIQTPSRLKIELRDEIPSPKATPMQPFRAINPSDTPYRSRKDRGSVTQTLNGQLNEIQNRDQCLKDNVMFQLNVDIQKYNYRTMRMKLTEVAEYFDEKIEKLIEALISNSNNQITDDQIGNPAVMSQSDIIAVGRIVPDSDDKMNSASMLLETCRRIGAGMQIPLDVTTLKSFSFYPGQVVALRGRNPEAKKFIPSEVLETRQLISAATSREELTAIAQRQTQPASIISAAGPFTTTDNLLYEPLDDLVSHVNKTHPDVVILCGPFLDITHPHLVNGDFDIPGEDGSPNENATFDDLFRATVTPRLNAIDPAITVILIPSTRDAVSNHAAFPQQPFDRKSLKLSKNIKCLSNPCTFSLNEVVFAVNSVDAIRDLTTATVQFNDERKGLFGAIHHILDSRSMYPIFPAPQKFNETGLETTGSSIDVPFMGLAEFTHAMPDVLITPSLVRALAEVTQNVIVVNPGLLARKTGGGTFATFTIQPPIVPNNESGDTVGHDVWNRARVDIIKL